jgi:hypothetical protein
VGRLRLVVVNIVGLYRVTITCIKHVHIRRWFFR